jgi:hypothetical protein
MLEIGEAYSEEQEELMRKVDSYMDTMSLKLGLLYCRRIMDLALGRLLREVQQLETRLDSGELMSDLAGLLQTLKDESLSTSPVSLSMQYAKY